MEHQYRLRDIVDVGLVARQHGWRAGENPKLGGMKPGVHSPTGYHPTGEAVDITDWRPGDGRGRTKAATQRLRSLGLFTEVLGPGDKGHDEHLHLALRGKQPLSDAQLEWGFTGRWRDSQGRVRTDMPAGAPRAAQLPPATLASTSPAVQTQAVTAPPPPPDWRKAASDPGRVIDPSQQGYWQREDIRQWAAANPKLAAAALQRHGADASWLQAQATAAPAAAKPAAAQPLPAGAPPAPILPPPQGATVGGAQPRVRPPDRGALNGVRVGGLQPYFFEIHADAAPSAGGRTGFIGSYRDATNPLFKALDAEYGNYGPNHSRQWRGGDLGAPKRGLSIIETRTAGTGMNDPAQHKAAAQRLLGALLKDPTVAAGQRQLHFWAGHADTSDPAQQGAAGGDASESAWNRGVLQQLKALAAQRGNLQVRTWDSVIANDPNDPRANWNRAQSLYEQWKNRNQGGR